MTELMRNCPKCKSDIIYTNKASFRTAQNKDRVCRRCASQESGFLERYGSCLNSGEANAFFGKKHSEETKDVLSKLDRSKYKTDSFRVTMRNAVARGPEHHMYGSSHNEHWIKKYGLEKANELEFIRRSKISEKTSGENNPMFGRPSPGGSGYGWKGWYRDWFFRSLRELSYVINVIEVNNWEWESAEQQKLGIKYVSVNGKPRTYFADFLINKSLLIEVKPARLHNTQSVLAKTTAALGFCRQNNFDYEIVDPEKLSDEVILALHTSKKLRFTDKYEQRYEEYRSRRSK